MFFFFELFAAWEKKNLNGATGKKLATIYTSILIPEEMLLVVMVTEEVLQEVERWCIA